MVSIPQQRDHVQGISLQDVQFLYEHGFNLIPLQPGTKKAYGSWEAYQDKRQSWDDLRRMYWNGGVAGINGVNGILSFDFDHTTTYKPVGKLLQTLGLPVNYEWVVLSGNGYHVWVRCTEEVVLNGTPKTKYVGSSINPTDYPFKQLEIRLKRSYTVLPPSVHPSGKSYEWRGETPVGEIAVVSASAIEAAFYSVAALQTELIDAPKQQETSTQQAPIQIGSKYASKALHGELEALRNAPEGTRNTTLNKAAFSLGTLVESGALDENMIEEELMKVGEEIGLETSEIEATVRSGLNAGISKPREAPKRKEYQGDDSELLQYKNDDEGNARSVMALYGDTLLHVNGYGWVVWNGKYWKADEAACSRLIMETLKRRHEAAYKANDREICSATMCNAARIEACKKVLSYLIEANINTFDANPDLLNVSNGVLHLPTGTLIDHNPKHRFTYCLKTAYNPDADYREWEQFIGESVKGGEEVVKFLQEAVGYSLTGRTKEECLFYVFGKTRAGKGTFTETISALLGSPLADEVPFKTFTAKRDGSSPNYDLAPLKPARFLVAAESNRYEKFNGGMVKQITGGGTISCEFKYQHRFTYKPTFKIWLTTNWPINGDPDDDGLWSRIRVVEFPNSHEEEEVTSLKDEFKKPEPLEGVLLWAVQGAMRWYERGKLETPKIMKQTKQEHREQADSVGLWIEECCEIRSGEWTANNAVRASYVNWCTENGYEPKQAKSFNDSLRVKGCTPNQNKRQGASTLKGVGSLVLTLS